MGMITSIRKRLWVVTVLMALALVGFIVMDMSSGGSASLFNNPDTVGKVAGQTLSWAEFQNTERVLYANSEVDYFGRKDYMWNHLNKQRRAFPEDYNFVPITYLFPADFDRF